eukprot:jgi/Phyca11/120557/e_gw1.41.135.1
MGRPNHPAWKYFVRGEKRNRFHHNAYCKFCSDKGVEPIAVRGVSGNMIRHLQNCIYCPAEVVTQLKLLSAQKDAASFNKRHQAPSRSGENIQETTFSPKKKARPNEDQGGESVFQLQNATLRAVGTSNKDTTGIEDFMPLQLPLMSSEMNGALTATVASSKPLSLQENLSRKENNSSAKPQLREITEKQEQRPSTTLSSNLPWDWVWTEQSARMFGALYSKIEPPSGELLSTVAATSHEKQLMKMKDEQIGVTLAVSCWKNKYPRSSFALLSLVNALGEATPWELIDMGIEDTAPEMLAEKIKINLTHLRNRGIHIINIVADTTLAYASSHLAVSSNEWTSLSIPVLPCFSHLLQMLLGIVLAESNKMMETVGEVIDLVQMFSSRRVLKVLRRECGDPDAVLHAPSRHDSYSFIEAVDSVRQYEDMIKIISSKVVQATSVSRDAAGQILTKPRPANLRKDSAGNTMEELAACGLSSAVIRTIQSAEFWENVVALSELISPIKETFKMMSSTFASSFSLSDIFYQFGRMQQRYNVILSDWEDTAGGGRSVELVRLVMRKVNDMWKLYDQPLMVLGYTFNYNLQDPFLARHQPPLQWLSIGKYAKQYFRGWFCAPPSTQNPSRLLALSDEVAAQFMENILAFKEHKYPFDSESMCDFDNPKFFYMLVSDSHPLMHMFGSRLFSFVTSTPPLGEVLPGKTFIPSAPSTTCAPQTLLPLLQMKLFAQTTAQPSKELLGFVQSNRPKGGITDDMHVQHRESIPETEATPSLSSILRSKKQWVALAKEWKAHWEKEEDTSKLPVLQTSRVLDTFTADLTLEQIFKEKLPSRLPHDREDAVVDV